ncbi:MAG: hypothetical protein E7773_10135 [Sphingomonas sp.]|uniref:hypothetical protein n=1 Tax=Sphingomonas sp. TaxID=28214 RepID=UPI00122A6406|nr:hypothetical protein [Sphingomonas sp.]THD35696.1 MAG: hypothetical protein E7773_10135 [Sphingomonas sp.]
MTGIASLLTPENIKSVGSYIGTLIVGAGAWAFLQWWNGRDRYQVHIDWETHVGQMGPDEYPTLYIQNVTDRALNVTRVRYRDALRRKTAKYAFGYDDPEYFPLPLQIKPHERGVLVLDHDAASDLADKAPWIVRVLHLPRVYVSITTMGRRERTFAAERCLAYPNRLPRFR